jgi:hypothetical protein
LVKTVPSAPSSAPYSTSVDKTQITVAMDPISSPMDGGSPMLSYNLQWDNGTNGATWTSLVGFSPYSLVQTFTKTGLTTGALYKFRYRVRNVYGWSSYSPVISVYAAVTPSKSSMIVTSLENSNVKFTWDVSDDGGLPLTKYTILF